MVSMSVAPPTSASFPHPHAVRDSARVLVVDDEVDAATGVKEILEAEGHLLGVAHDGPSAMQAAIMMNPDVAFVDLRLKGEYGLDVIEALRSKFPDLVCVVQTGESDSSVVISALRQGVYDYLVKPLDPEQLISVVARAAEKVALQDERRVMMDQLARARDRAELASRSKTEFLTRMSAGLGRQFDVIVKAAGDIAAEAHGPAGASAYVEDGRMILAGATRLGEVMRWIGELGQLEAGGMRAKTAEFDLRSVIDSVMATFRQAMTEKSLNASVSVADGLPLLTTDADHMRRILSHLVSNAVKFSRPRGRVEVHALIDPAGDLRIRVIDNGIGMEQDKIRIAMTPFGRLGDGGNDPFSVGLGLPLAEKYAHLLGGRLGLASKTGAGTIVELNFPQERVLHPAQTAASA